MAKTFRSSRKYLLFFMDFILWNLSYYLTFSVIYNKIFLNELPEFTALFLPGLATINVIFPIIFIASKMYTKLWRYADVIDFFYEWVACMIANSIFFVLTLFYPQDFGLRIPIMMMLLSTFLLFLFRFVYRISIAIERRSRLKSEDVQQKRMLIVGAGEAAMMLLKELANNPENEYSPICIVDDDKSKVGRSMFGIDVAGTTADLPELVKKYRINMLIFSILTLSAQDRKRILDICAATKVEVKLIPSLYNSMREEDSSIKVTATIRDVEVEDLLSRDPIVLDIERSRSYISGQTVLVTGGGGSIGSELCRQIANLQPKKLIVLDIYENGAYDIEQELQRKFDGDLNLEIQIGNICDFPRMDQLFAQQSIDIVFHAAAHKHVPLMETNPEEAVKNNVFGTLNLLRISDKYKIKRFVQISTDKAVNPTNIMGATKRICEMMVQQMHKSSQTSFAAVRFGNVLGSNGSVIPLFKQQIKEGGPVTVTDPKITRFFMTIPEAVSLVLTAGSMAQGGEIFVLDMGEPVKINDLAVNLINLCGLELGRDIDIKYTGLRPGEKLYEEILLDEEGIDKTDNQKIYIGKPIKLNDPDFWAHLQTLENVAFQNDGCQIEILLSEIVPTFRHNRDCKQREGL